MNSTHSVHPMLIDGAWVEGASGEAVEIINPANGEVVGRVPVATEAEIDRAVDSSVRCFSIVAGYPSCRAFSRDDASGRGSTS